MTGYSSKLKMFYFILLIMIIFLASIGISQRFSWNKALAEQGRWVFNHEFYLIINTAVGGHWPGYPDETTEFPQEMLVDYIRMYNLEDELIWSDEFEGAEINRDFWSFEVGNGHAQGIPGWGNAELQYYTAGENARIKNDKLVIDIKEENRTDQYGEYNYTSTRMVTRNNVHMKYGRIEIKAKLPEGQGIWPAFWMLGTKAGWPDGGEIDIMELLGHRPSEVHGTVHGPGYSGGHGISNNYILKEGSFTGQFNIFILEWEEDKLRWYINEEKEPFHEVQKTEQGTVIKR